MANTNQRTGSIQDRIRANPKFKQLESTRSRFAWTLSAVVLVVYYAYMLTVAFAPKWLHVPLSEGLVTTVGVPVGAGLIVFFWLLTGWYIRRANGEFDKLNEEVLKECQ